MKQEFKAWFHSIILPDKNECTSYNLISHVISAHKVPLLAVPVEVAGFIWNSPPQSDVQD